MSWLPVSLNKEYPVSVLFLCGTVELLHNFRGYHSITKSLITLLYLNQLNLSTLVMPPLVATHI
ncbi:hypothetical protein WDU94_000794 [Cyamophila willieti]